MPDGLHLDNAALGPAGLGMEYRMIERRRSVWPDVGAEVVKRLQATDSQIADIQASLAELSRAIIALDAASQDRMKGIIEDAAQRNLRLQLRLDELDSRVANGTLSLHHAITEARFNVWPDFWWGCKAWLRALWMKVRRKR